jgi:hypothetical protein
MNESGERRTYEPTDIRIRPFVLVGVVLIIAAVIGSLVLYGASIWFTNRLEAGQVQLGPLARTTQVPPAPRLQISPRQDLQTMLAEHNQRLNSYGWVDQNAGTAHIPIERAMDLLLERGLPVRSDGAGLEQSPDPQAADDLESDGGQPPSPEQTPQPGTAP